MPKQPSWASQLRETIENNVLDYVENLASESVIDDVEELLDTFDSAKGSLKNQANKLFDSLEERIKGMSDVQTGRLWTDSSTMRMGLGTRGRAPRLRDSASWCCPTSTTGGGGRAMPGGTGRRLACRG